MKKQTAGRNALGEFAPKFAELNDDGVLDSSLEYHIMHAKENGITAEEMAEAITHIAFYAGWPKAWAAFNYAKKIYTEVK